MKQNSFETENHLYDQKKGIDMNKQLSNWRMTKIETCRGLHYFGTIWMRDVDDVVAVFSTKEWNVCEFV